VSDALAAGSRLSKLLEVFSGLRFPEYFPMEHVRELRQSKQQNQRIDND
jgi:hypothetical protein